MLICFQTRVRKYGTKTYHSSTVDDLNAVCAIHNHDNNRLTIGMGEVITVMNGLEFRTRHNDYQLAKRAAGGKSEYISTPDVPPSVLAQPNVKAQIAEMREYFRAFHQQNETIRQYKNYFKPNLCYMEGAWGYAGGSLRESFSSDRHFLDADSWLALEEKIRFNAYSGSKDHLENLAFLPTMIVGSINGTIPKVLQWNYKIHCHPLSIDLPLDRFRVVDDIASRMDDGLMLEDYKLRRKARFQLADKLTGRFRDSKQNPNLLDLLMNEVPGYDGYGAVLKDDVYSTQAFYPRSGKPLNAAYYHRQYVVKELDATGVNKRVRGFSDMNLFAAMTAQEEVAAWNTGELVTVAR